MGQMPCPGAQLHTAGKHQGPQITELVKGLSVPAVGKGTFATSVIPVGRGMVPRDPALPGRAGRAHLALCCFLRSCLCLVVPAYLEEGGDHGNAPTLTVVLPQESCCLLPQMKLTGSQHLRLLAVTADV